MQVFEPDTEFGLATLEERMHFNAEDAIDQEVMHPIKHSHRHGLQERPQVTVSQDGVGVVVQAEGLLEHDELALRATAMFLLQGVEGAPQVVVGHDLEGARVRARHIDEIRAVCQARHRGHQVGAKETRLGAGRALRVPHCLDRGLVRNQVRGPESEQGRPIELNRCPCCGKIAWFE